jgi:hypothetical protein
MNQAEYATKNIEIKLVFELIEFLSNIINVINLSRKR